MSKIDIKPLPKTIPLFPLSGVLLLPHGNLPLHIFEPRYLAMVEDALEHDQVIGMIQPAESENLGNNNLLYKTGCIGRICQQSESTDGRRYIILTGISRFDLNEELPLYRGYRRASVTYKRFQVDLEPNWSEQIDIETLMKSVQMYFEIKGLKPDWEAMQKTPNEALVNLLSMICPFGPAEKQGLLEAKTLVERMEMLSSLLSLDSHLHETAKLMQ